MTTSQAVAISLTEAFALADNLAIAKTAYYEALAAEKAAWDAVTVSTVEEGFTNKQWRAVLVQAQTATIHAAAAYQRLQDCYRRLGMNQPATGVVVDDDGDIYEYETAEGIYIR